LIRRYFGAIVAFTAISASEARVRQSLRLDPDLWEKIDRERGRRAGSVSRNTWITEAILEKLSRDRDDKKQRRLPDA
jgi:hypothetical protein